jgi:hypothetical protein
MAGSLKLTLIEPQENFQDGIMGFIEKLVEFVAPPTARNQVDDVVSGKPGIELPAAGRRG